MKRDFHIHMNILKKPETVDEFVETAIAKGFEEICITDHMPLRRSGAFDRIPAGSVGEYCEAVGLLAERYSGRIVIKTGIEIDHHPEVIAEIEEVLKQGSFDYVIGSTHMHLFGYREGMRFSEFVERSYKNVQDAVKTGYYDTVSHINMYRWVLSRTNRFPFEDDCGNDPYFAELIEETLLSIKKSGMKLEINPHYATATGDLKDMYPSERILLKAIDFGVDFIFGSDAHSPDQVGDLYERLVEHPVYSRVLEK